MLCFSLKHYRLDTTNSKKSLFKATAKSIQKLLDFFFFLKQGVPIVAQQVKNLTGVYEDAGSISGLTHSVKDLVLPQTVV